MAENQTTAAPETAAEPTTGRVTRIQGSVIDVEFPVGHLPDIYNALTVELANTGVHEEGETTKKITLEVEQHLGDSTVRTVALKPTDGLVRGATVLDTGGRAATQTFAEREIGDVLVTFEAETKSIAKQYADQGFEPVTPSMSLFAAFPVAVVTENAQKDGSAEVAAEYLNWLYTPKAQEIMAQNNYRSTDAAVTAAHAADFPQVKLVTVDEVFGGWPKIQSEHLAEGAILDKVFVNR